MTEIGNLSLRHRLPRRLTQLFVGLMFYGLSMGLMIRARLGVDPWDVLHQGLSRRTGVDIGYLTIGIGVVVLLLWIPLRQLPGIGTIANVVLIGLALDATLALVPTPHLLIARIACLFGGVVLCGIGSGLYIGARLGPGPRDGLMTGVVRRYAGRRWASIRGVRTAIELTVVAIGWLLGGNVGFGTLLFAVAIGPLAQIFIPLFTLRSPAAGSTASSAAPAASPAAATVAPSGAAPATSFAAGAAPEPTAPLVCATTNAL